MFFWAFLNCVFRVGKQFFLKILKKYPDAASGCRTSRSKNQEYSASDNMKYYRDLFESDDAFRFLNLSHFPQFLKNGSTENDKN